MRIIETFRRRRRRELRLATEKSRKLWCALRGRVRAVAPPPLLGIFSAIERPHVSRGGKVES